MLCCFASISWQSVSHRRSPFAFQLHTQKCFLWIWEKNGALSTLFHMHVFKKIFLSGMLARSMQQNSTLSLPKLLLGDNHFLTLFTMTLGEEHRCFKATYLFNKCYHTQSDVSSKWLCTFRLHFWRGSYNALWKLSAGANRPAMFS